MKRGIQLIGLLVVCLPAIPVHAAGGVIAIGVSNGQLTVSNGTLDNLGFADRMFVESGSDGFPLESNVTGFGPAYLWTVPGVRITGMAVNSGLYIEALSRPVKNASPAKDRVLWYWNSALQTIQDVPEDNHFVIYKLFAAQGIYLSGTTDATPPAVKIAAPLSNDLNIDNYGGLVRFALHREVPPPAGVYAFFARLKSDQYQPSDPFFVTFNNGQLSGTQMMTGALAINAAAVDAQTLDGDFNGDGTVDAADYTVWRNGLGSKYTQIDYGLWKANFGRTNHGSASRASGVSVPEPNNMMLAILALLAAPISLRYPTAPTNCRLRWSRSQILLT